MATSSPLHPSQLPRELLLHIFRYLNEGLTKWETLRQQLHLRLVSTWFGSARETVSLRNIRVNIHPSMCVFVSHLTHLLRSNRELARKVQKLVVIDKEPNQSAKEAIGGSARTYQFDLAQMRSERTNKHRQLTTLVEVCSDVQALDIHVGVALCSTKPSFLQSLPLGELKALRSVVLRSAAITYYLQEWIQANSNAVSLSIVPSSVYNYIPEEGRRDLSSIIQDLASDFLSLAHFHIREATSSFSRNFIARISVRTRTLELGISSFVSFTKLIDIIIRMSSLSTIQEIQFILTDKLRSRAEASQAAHKLDISSELQRLIAAGPEGLTVVWK